jgi:hypothetical protein
MMNVNTAKKRLKDSDMVALQKYSETGKLCPKCGNHSVFQKKVYKFCIIYTRTLFKCEMIGCDYIIKQNETT